MPGRDVTPRHWWTAADERRLRELWTAGVSLTDIAAEMSGRRETVTTVHGVWRKVLRLQLAPRTSWGAPVPPPPIAPALTRLLDTAKRADPSRGQRAQGTTPRRYPARGFSMLGGRL